MIAVLPSRMSLRIARVAAVLSLAALLSDCSLRALAVNQLGNALAKSGTTWASDDDPELVRDATPFVLKTIESLLEESPRHKGLLLAAASGFTQYAYAFVQAEADLSEARDLTRATALRVRARKLYLRAVGYGYRGLEVDHPGLRARLAQDPKAGVEAVAERGDVALLYWTAAPLAAAMSLAKEDAELAADLPVAEALMRRALELDESFGAGSIHDFFIAFEGGRPASAGGSVERARAHLERSLALAQGRRAAPYVSFAETVSVSTQNRAEFVALLEQALAVDVDRAPEYRLANMIAQQRARWLLARADELFIE